MKRTPEQWVTTLEQQQSSSLTIQEFCQQEKISTSGFYKHKKSMTNNSRFSLVTNAPAIKKSASAIEESISGSNPQRISLTTSAGHLSLPESISPEFLIQLVRGLS